MKTLALKYGALVLVAAACGCSSPQMIDRTQPTT